MPIRRDIHAETDRARPRHGPAAIWSWRPPRVPTLVCLLAIVLAGVGVVAARAQPQVNAASAPAAAQLIERLDAHVDDLPSAPELEMDLSLSQTIDDCGVPLHGQFCLRYSISEDDVPVQAGYGLIPASQVKVHGPVITLVTNTARDPGFVRVAGAGGVIAVTWTAFGSLPRVASHVAAMQGTSAHGTIVGMAIPSTNVTSAVVIHGGQ